MNYTGVKLYADKRCENVELESNKRILIDGVRADPYCLTNSFLILYSVFDSTQPVNKVATKFFGFRIYGDVILVNSNVEEIENPDYNPSYHHDSDDDTDVEETYGEEEYITKRRDFDVETFRYMYRSRFGG